MYRLFSRDGPVPVICVESTAYSQGYVPIHSLMMPTALLEILLACAADSFNRLMIGLCPFLSVLKALNSLLTTSTYLCKNHCLL